ncbi:MAG TPA: DRTGG domain-containing protein [Spirochaetales bacterium]|nr:DRTGG domain-containing protein [Spirochaetales bacterium]
MNIGTIPSVLPCSVAQGSYEDRPLSGGFAGDLLSDVMGKAKADAVLVTVQAHRNTIAVASLAGLAAVVVCHGRPVPEEMLDAARDEGVAVFVTELDPFEASGRLWAALNGRT